MFLGKHLLVLLDAPSNGTSDAFGVITRVWNDNYVNITVFPDYAQPRLCSSVLVAEDLETALKFRETNPGVIAYHPPRPSA